MQNICNHKKGSRNVMGAELCLAHDMGGGGIGGPLLVDMQPYGCFIVYGQPDIGKVKNGLT